VSSQINKTIYIQELILGIVFFWYRLDGSELRVVSSSEEKVELSFRSDYNPSLPNSVRLNIDKRYT
jgi:hypothetical protein